MKQKAQVKPASSGNCLAGQFFHSIKDGKVEWQGLIIGSPEPGWYLVQLYEWISGSESCRKLVNFSDMHGWMFYDDAEAWRFSYEYGSASRFVERD